MRNESISKNIFHSFWTDQAENPERKAQSFSGHLLLGLGQPLGNGAQAARVSGSNVSFKYIFKMIYKFPKTSSTRELRSQKL